MRSRILRSCSVRRASRSSCFGAVAQALEHALGDVRVEQRLTGRDPPDRVDELGALDLLEQVAGGAGHDRVEQRFVVGERSEDHALNFGIPLSVPLGRPRPRCRRGVACR